MLSQTMKQRIPWIMAGGRAALGPLLLAAQACRWNGIALAAMIPGMICAALLSDIFDGVLARRWQCDTPGVRLFDSMADTVFYLCVAAALCLGQPRLWSSHVAWLIALMALEGLRFAVDLAKFGKPSSYHSYLAKTWGLVLAVAVMGAFAAGLTHPRACGVLLSAGLGLGVLCDLEGLAMSALLPVWRNDVRTLSAAWRLRQEWFSLARGTRASSCRA
jgi:CDP-diacylglycerol--glycerol-3-phosphate 3-phosphatidyltransferase